MRCATIRSELHPKFLRTTRVRGLTPIERRSGVRVTPRFSPNYARARSAPPQA